MKTLTYLDTYRADIPEKELAEVPFMLICKGEDTNHHSPKLAVYYRNDAGKFFILALVWRIEMAHLFANNFIEKLYES